MQGRGKHPDGNIKESPNSAAGKIGGPAGADSWFSSDGEYDAPPLCADLSRAAGWMSTDGASCAWGCSKNPSPAMAPGTLYFRGNRIRKLKRQRPIRHLLNAEPPGPSRCKAAAIGLPAVGGFPPHTPDPSPHSWR